MDFNFENWQKGKYVIDNVSIHKIEPKEIEKILSRSLVLLNEYGQKEFERLKLIFEKRIGKSIDKNKAIRVAVKYYESIFTISIKEEERGYLEAEGIYYQDTQYDVRFIREVQIAYTKLLRGNLNVFVPNAVKETFDYNGNLKCYAAITAIAWNKYLEYLKSLLNPDNNRTVSNSDQVEKTEREIDLNCWNERGKSLYDYLCENYKGAKGRQKFINIYHFLKNSDKFNERQEIGFYYSIKDYKTLIRDSTNYELKKVNKPANYTSQLVKLKSHYSAWVNTFNKG